MPGLAPADGGLPGLNFDAPAAEDPMSDGANARVQRDAFSLTAARMSAIKASSSISSPSRMSGAPRIAF